MGIFRAQAEGKQAGGKQAEGKQAECHSAADCQSAPQGYGRAQAEADARFRRERGGLSAGQHDIAGACSAARRAPRRGRQQGAPVTASRRSA